MRELIIALSVLSVAALHGEEWSAPIQKKPLGTHTKKEVNIPIHPKLDVGAYHAKVNGKP